MSKNALYKKIGILLWLLYAVIVFFPVVIAIGFMKLGDCGHYIYEKIDKFKYYLIAKKGVNNGNV